MLVAINAVVIARNIHIRKGIAGFDITAMQRRAALHEFITQKPCQIVEELAAHRLFLDGFSLSLGFFCFFSLLFGLFIAVHAEADGAQKVEEDIHTAGHRAGIVQPVQEVGHLLRQGDAALLGSLADLVSGGVEHHTRVVVVLLDHIGQVLPPPLRKIRYIIVFRLMDIPVVDVFVHNEHTLTVTLCQQSLGAGVVRRADGIVACFFQQAHLAGHGIKVADSAQQAVIVMDAGPLNDDPLTVEREAVFAPSHRAHAEGLDRLIICKLYAASVQIRCFRCPKTGIVDGKRKNCFPIRFLPNSGESLNHQLNRAGRTSPDTDFHHRRLQRHCTDAHTVEQYVLIPCRPQLNGTIQSRAGIPPAVGLVGVAGNHSQFVIPCAQKWRTVYIKIGIPIGAERRLLAVQPDLSVVINTLKFQNVGVRQLVFGHRQGSLILIVIPLIPAGVDAARAQGRARLRQHGVMGQGHGPAGCGIAQVTASPAGEKGCCFHRSVLTFRCFV